MMAACTPNPLELCVQAGLNKKLLETERKELIDAQLDAIELDFDESQKKTIMASANERLANLKNKSSEEYKNFLRENEYQIRKECMEARFK